MISKHGEKRIRQRVGLPKKAVGREAARALVYGLRRRDVGGKLRAYMDDLLMRQTRYSDREQTDIVFYNNFIYIFTGPALDILVTVFALPAKYRERRIKVKDCVEELETA